jgi:hypothetical protein
MPITQFDPTEGPSKEQQASEAAVFTQGQKIQEAQAADRAARQAQMELDQEQDVSLIGGKFKSQEDLLKAYQELERQRTKENQGDAEEEEQVEESVDNVDEAEETTESDEIFNRAAQEYTDNGQLSDDAIDALSQMDSKDLIKAYVDYYGRNAANYQQQELEATQLDAVKEIAGGSEEYDNMIGWAAQSLPPDEIDAFNLVTESGNLAAIRFAVEALNNRYRAAEGFEGELVTGKASTSTNVKAYRSQAELARDIANPLYHSDPAFRADVEARLQASKDLL